MKKSMYMERGFTLVELLVVIAILGILAAIGIPLYSDYTDASVVTSVQNNLRSIYLQEHEYFVDNAVFYSTGAVCDADYSASINTNLFNNVQVLTADGFDYCITQATVNDFTATASEQDGARVFTITNNNVVNF